MRRTLVLMAGHDLSPGEDEQCSTGSGHISPAVLYDAAFRDAVLWAQSFDPGQGMAPPDLVLAYQGDRDWFQQRASTHWLLVPMMGADVGQHLDNLLIVLGTRPDDRTIFVGPFTPHLPPRALDSAYISLGQREVVLAPCERAGVYLIGVRGRWPSGILRGVRWQTAHAQHDLLKAFRRAHLNLAQMQELYAMQGKDDLQRLSADLGVFPDRAMPNLRRLVDTLSDDVA